MRDTKNSSMGKVKLSVAPSGRQQKLVLIFISVIMLGHILVPLSFYLGWRDDERFSWRMFSSYRLQSCELHIEGRLNDDNGLVRLDDYLEDSWLRVMRAFHQPALYDSMLPWLCTRVSASEIEVTRSCKWPAGNPAPDWQITHQCDD